MGMNPRLLRPTATGFDPRRISGLVAWWDAQVASSYDIETGVSEWRDLSGNGNTVTQAVTNDQPTISDINGKTAFQFDGSNDQLAAASPILTVTQAGQFSTFVVHRLATGGANLGYFWSNGTANVGFGFLCNQNNAAMFYGTAGTSPALNSSTRANDLPEIIGFTHTNQVGQFSINGALDSAITTSSTTGTATSNFLIGNRPGNTASTAFYPGRLGAVLIYNRALSLAERSRVERWLGQRWGITVA
jgi:hypothetical protein